MVKSPFLKKCAFYGNGFRSGGLFMAARVSPHVKKGLMDEWMDQWNGMIGMYTEKKREEDIDGYR